MGMWVPITEWDSGTYVLYFWGRGKWKLYTILEENVWFLKDMIESEEYAVARDKVYLSSDVLSTLCLLPVSSS